MVSWIDDPDRRFLAACEHHCESGNPDRLLAAPVVFGRSTREGGFESIIDLNPSAPANEAAASTTGLVKTLLPGPEPAIHNSRRDHIDESPGGWLSDVGDHALSIGPFLDLNDRID